MLLLSLIPNIDTAELAEHVKTAASESITEEDLRIRVESVFGDVLRPLGLSFGRYETSAGKYSEVSASRIDALHSFVVIEYERPHTFENKAKYLHAVEQVKNGINGHAGDLRQNPARYFGVAIDGYRIGFVRFKSDKNDFEVTKVPLDVNRTTIAKMVEAIVGLRRKALYAEELLRDFGPESELSKKCIGVLYERISGRVNGRTEMLFADWKRVFSQVCAYEPDKLSGLEEYYGFTKGSTDVERLLFSVHTYFALLMKLLAAEVSSLYWPIMGSYLKALDEAYHKGLITFRDQLKELENGGLFTRLGISNFLEGDYFSWYLDEWSESLSEVYAEVIGRLSDYDPSTADIEPERIKDLFKQLYQKLVPKKVRHDLGEYYTPDWLADLVLDEVGYQKESFADLKHETGDSGAPLNIRLLDPSCGSGTFLVLALGRLRDYIEDEWLDKRIALERITKNVVGFDLNPLAVLAARANYLIAIGDLLREKGSATIEIPVYLADSILAERKTTVLGESTYSLRTIVGEFRLPMELADTGRLGEVLSIMEECLNLKCDSRDFSKRLAQVGLASEDAILSDLYRKMLSLEEQGKNGIWLRVLRNSFAPFLAKRFDYVVGNPPWINWDNLPEAYRDVTKDLWERHGLVQRTKGFGLGKVKKDIAMLFVASCVERFLTEEGKLGMLVPFTLFKTQAGAGFRVFLTYKCAIIKTHDLVSLAPFEGALNRTSLLVVRQGSTRFPVGCTSWGRGAQPSVPFGATLAQVVKTTTRDEMVLEPIEGVNRPESSWYMVQREALTAVRKALGPAAYRAFAGVYTGLNSAYWVRVVSREPGDILVVTNLANSGKKVIEEITAPIEAKLVYPLIRGRDVAKWRSSPSGYIIVPHDRSSGRPLAERELRVAYPKCMGYLIRLQGHLSSRNIQKLWGKDMPFYSLYDIGEYSFAPFKVAWKYVAGKISGKGEFAVAVIPSSNDAILGEGIPIPNEKLMFIPIGTRQEADYVAAFLNSSIVRLIVASYTIETAISTHVLKHVRVPKYEPNNALHMRLANLSLQAHDICAKGETDRLEALEEEIDVIVAKMFGLKDAEVKAVRDSLDVLLGEETGQADEEENVD